MFETKYNFKDMPRSTRRSTSQQLNRRSSVNPNILNFSSDCDIDQKRNSQWWRNISDNSQRYSILTNSKVHPDSYKVLNTHSTITEDQNSQWWKNLSENLNASLPKKLDNIGEQTDLKNKDLPDKILSQSESDDDEFFRKKSVFASQKQRSQKSRYSTAFNLNIEKDTEEEQNNPSHTEKQNLENEEFKNQLEDDKIKSPSKVTKGNKKKRRTKSIFSKKVVKRKFSDAFTVSDNGHEKSEQPNMDILDQNSDSVIANVSVSKESIEKQTKEGLFKLNRKKKKYSEAFLNDDGSHDITIEKDDTEKSSKQLRISGPSNQIQTEEISEIVENFPRATAIPRSKFHYSDSTNEEIIIEEVQTQKDSSYVRNQSLHKTIEITPKNKNSMSRVIQDEKSDGESSNEEIPTQKNDIGTSNRRINVTKEMKMNLFKIDKKGKKYSEAFLNENEIDETKIHSSHHQRKDQISCKENTEEIENQEKILEKSINVTKEMKPNLFKRNTKSKKYSEAFLNENEVDETKIHSSLHQRKGQISDSENAEEIENQEKSSENSINVTKELKPNLFKRNTKSKKYSEAFLGPSSSNILQTEDNESSHDKNDSESSEEDINIEEIQTQKENVGTSNRSINVTKEIKMNLFKRDTKSKKYSEAFLNENDERKVDETKINSSHHQKKSQISHKENAEESKIQEETSENSINVTKQTKPNLFKRNTKSKKYSEAFLGPSSSKILQTEDNESSNENSGERQVDETIPSKQHEKENLFTLQNKNRNFSEAFDNIFEVDDVIKKNSGFVFVEEVAAKQQKENFESLKNKAPPYSQAFMELISMQKPVEEERVIVTPAKLIDTEDNEENANKSNKVAEMELLSDNDTKFSSIPSISISPEIKHPLFRPKARKSLYSVKSSNNEQSFIHSDTEPQQYLEKNKSRRISAKRSSLRSTSPESGISKFFDDSLISSTKLFINPNEGSDRSAKKKRGKPLKLVSVIHENSFNKPETENQKSKDNNGAESEEPTKNKSLQKTRKSKLVIESEKSIDSEEIQVNKDTDTVSKSTSKRGRKTRSMAAGSENPSKEVEEQSNEIDPEEPLQQVRKSKSVTKIHDIVEYNAPDDEVMSNAEAQTRDVTPTSKRGRKSKSTSRTSKIIENRVPEYSDDPATEKKISLNTEKPGFSTDTDAVSKSTSKRGRKTRSLAENRSKEVEEQNNEIEPEVPLQKVRKSKSVSKIHDVVENNASDDELIPIRDVNSSPKKGRKSKSAPRASTIIEKSAPETETIGDGKSQAEQPVKNEKSVRKSKSISKVLEDSESRTFANEMMDESKKISDKLKKNKNLTGITKLINIAEDLGNDGPNEEMIKNDNNIKLDKNVLKRTRKSKSVTNNPENQATDKKINLKTRKSSVSIPVEGTLEDNQFTIENENEEIDKQKQIASKIPKNFQKEVEQDTNKSNADKISPVENITDIPSDETVERIITSYERKFESVKNTENRKSPSVDEEIRNIFLKSSKLPAAKHVESINEKRQSSYSNVITINSSTSRARSSQFSHVNRTTNKDIEKWLSKNNTNNALIEQNNSIENINFREFLSNFGLRSRSKAMPNWNPKTASENDGETEERIQELLTQTVQKIRLEKQTKSPPQEPVKKITDFFTKLNKNEKLKPIPKKNNIKKTSKPIGTARIINNKPYFSKKLFCGKRWCTPEFYKFLQNKLANEFGEETINESEKIMKYIVQSVTVVIKSKKYLKAEVDNLKKELAKHNIIETLYDFYCFCFDFLPVEYRNLVIPRTRAYTAEPTVPCNPNDFFKQIEF